MRPVAILLTAALVACGEPGTGPTPEITGSWDYNSTFGDDCIMNGTLEVRSDSSASISASGIAGGPFSCGGSYISVDEFHAEGTSVEFTIDGVEHAGEVTADRMAGSVKVPSRTAVRCGASHYVTICGIPGHPTVVR